MRILVTGSQGFIGSRLVEKLRGEHEVVDFTRQDDVLSLDSLLVKSSGADVVIHAAAHLYDDMPTCIGTNVHGTANVVEAAKRCGCKAVVFLSTLRAMYAGSDGPINEDSPEANPCDMSNYVLSKWMAEQLVRRFPRQWVILRLSGVFGTGRKYATLAQRMLTDATVSVRNAGELCDMVPVRDVVDAVGRIIERLSNLGNETFIIASGSRQTVGEVAAVAQQLHSFVLKDRGKTARGWSYDVSKARGLLGFQPTGLPESLRRFKEELDGGHA